MLILTLALILLVLLLFMLLMFSIFSILNVVDVDAIEFDAIDVNAGVDVDIGIDTVDVDSFFVCDLLMSMSIIDVGAYY